MIHPRRRNAVRSTRIALLASLAVSCFSLASPTPKAVAETAAFGSVVLVWTTPGDDGTIGRASKYDLRISTKAITSNDTLSWWNTATIINMAPRVPGMAGTRDSVMLGGLISGIRYYAILRVGDEKPNWSGFSNVATFTPGTITSTDGQNDAVPEFVVGAPRPSPSSGRTQIDFELPRAMEVHASVYDAQGRLVRTLESGTLAAGPHVLRWNGDLDRGGNAGSGVYWISIAAGSVRKRAKVVVVH
jgi:flagellar hook capping protein FlgD